MADSKLNVTLASDVNGWNKTVNGQLVIELGRNDRLCVTGFVPKNTQQQRDHASSLNIELVDAEDQELQGFSSSDLLLFPPENLEIDVLFIHSHGQDVGRQAQIIKKEKQCKWVQVVHSFSEECCTTQCKDEDDHKLQTTLCEKADAVIAIGPKTAESCRRALRSAKKHNNVLDLTPGVCEDLTDVRECFEDLATFRVLMSGSSKHFKDKGCDIAAKAIKSLNTPSYHLTVVVKSCDNVAEVTQALLNEGIDSQQLKVSVADSREDWRHLVCAADLAIKPSRNEGFGMSGLLAISASLPVLVSDNCGLGLVLKTVLFGNMHVVDSCEPQAWADRIKQVRTKDPKIRHKEAEELRDAYTNQFNWKDQCEKVVEKLLTIVSQRSESTEKAVEDIQKKVQETLTLSDQKSTNESKDIRRDVVDAGRSEVNKRLSLTVSEIPLSVHSKVCVSLNVRKNVRFNDFRMLAEKVGLTRDEINFVAQLENPTDEILKMWSSKPSEAIVANLIELLKHKDLERMDVVEILEDWVNKRGAI